MAMNAGSVTITLVDGDFSYSGSGLARAIGEALAPAIAQAAKDALDAILTESIPGYQPQPVAKHRHYFPMAIAGPVANAVASAVVAHLAANAKAHVTSEVLGRTPSPNNANTNIQPPSAAVDIPIV
jgi:hypothetical protein